MSEDWFIDSEGRRRQFLDSFLKTSYTQTQMSSDMAPRNYYRVRVEGKTYVLLESAPDGHPQALVGHELGAYLKINHLLSDAGFRVPEIITEAADQGLILVEDFGDKTLEKALSMSSAGEAHAYYRDATEYLLKLKEIPPQITISLPSFTNSNIYRFGQRFADFFLPYYFDRPATQGDARAYWDVMREIEKTLPDITFGFVHGDFQLPNVMVLEDGTLGLLDFQGAMNGPPVYDLTNLLHDARRVVDPQIIGECKALYFGSNAEILEPWYHYLCLHFHLRCIGQFIRVALTLGRTNYLNHLDRLRHYLDQNQTPAFQKYCKDLGLDFSKKLPPVDLERLRAYVHGRAT